MVLTGYGYIGYTFLLRSLYMRFISSVRDALINKQLL